MVLHTACAMRPEIAQIRRTKRRLPSSCLRWRWRGWGEHRIVKVRGGLTAQLKGYSGSVCHCPDSSRPCTNLQPRRTADRARSSRKSIESRPCSRISAAGVPGASATGRYPAASRGDRRRSCRAPPDHSPTGPGLALYRRKQRPYRQLRQPTSDEWDEPDQRATCQSDRPQGYDLA